MLRKPVVFSENAAQDLEEILANVAFFTCSYTSAERLYLDLMNTIEKLGDFPKMGVIGKVENTREFWCRGYRIVYQEFEDEVLITTIIHTRRQYP